MRYFPYQKHWYPSFRFLCCSSLSFLPIKKIRLLRSGTRRCRRFNPLTLPLLFLLPFSPSVLTLSRCSWLWAWLSLTGNCRGWRWLHMVVLEERRDSGTTDAVCGVFFRIPIWVCLGLWSIGLVLFIIVSTCLGCLSSSESVFWCAVQD